jgi:RNA polymerase sporulation-specific sigma factor
MAQHQRDLTMQTQLEPGTEAALLAAATQGDHDAVEQLMIQYKPLVRARARAYHLYGADREDLVQEGMIGLFKAIRDFRTETGSLFAGFADLCVTRQIQSAVKAAARKKHLPLNTYLSLSADMPKGKGSGEPSVAALRESENREPERQVIYREEARRIATVLEAHLSPLERQVVRLYITGVSYQEIARHMGRTPKSIDNALQRIRRKVGDRLQRGGT